MHLLMSVGKDDKAFSDLYQYAWEKKNNHKALLYKLDSALNCSNGCDLDD